MRIMPTSAVASDADGPPAEGTTAYHPYEGANVTTPTVNWTVWLRWVVYTIIGYLLAWGLSVLVGTYAPGGTILGPFVAVAGMALVGLAQWLILRRLINGMKWVGWVVATAAGQFLGAIVMTVTVLGPVVFGVLGDLPDTIGVTPTQFLIGFASGFMLGLVIGFLQWLVLRRYIRNAVTAWWILGMALAQAVASGVSGIVRTDVGLGGLVTLLLSRLLVGTIVGAITGAVLMIILRTRQKHQAEAPPVQPSVQSV